MANKNGDVARRQLKNVALFGAEDELSKESNQMSIGKIKLPKQQPRRYFDPQKQESLMASIRQYGILEPLLVRPMGSGYELVAGERRFRAAQALEIKEVPVVIREMNDQESQYIALVENLQREDLNPIEETEAILDLLSLELKLPREGVIALLHQLKKQNGNNVIPKVEEVFASLGSMGWLSFVQNRLPILNLPEDVLEALRQGQIAYTKARAIGQVKDEVAREELLFDAIESDLSLVEIRERLGSDKKAPKTESDLGARLSAVYKKSRKTNLWDDPKKKQKFENALVILENLLENSKP
jgi:ParB family transcriptional regulator, chromosome partitioning protein